MKIDVSKLYSSVTTATKYNINSTGKSIEALFWCKTCIKNGIIINAIQGKTLSLVRKYNVQ